jgi:diazepam-binding inhibitor (GABA receptor modulator, acyl-CoA-binding protein)
MDAKSLKLLLQSQGVPKSVTPAEFEKAAKEAKDLKNLDNDQRLQLYGLYKQSVEGNVTSKRPGIFDMVGQAKW